MNDRLRLAIEQITSLEPDGVVGFESAGIDGERNSLVEAQALLDWANLRLGQVAPSQARQILDWLEPLAPALLVPWWQLVREKLNDSPAPSHSPTTQSIEDWWARRFPRLRKQLGIYHTPAHVVDHCWQTLDPDRWLDPDTGWLLDPASGTNEFLRGALRVAVSRGAGTSQINQLFARWVGVEITFASYLSGWLELALELSALSVPLESLRHAPQLYWQDATRLRVEPACATEQSATEPTDSDPLRRQDFGWVIGNPPYSSRVERTNPEILRLLKGKWPGPGGATNYYAFRNQPLGERKTWLHDLYVRFYRLAQWWTHDRNEASVAFVSNRGWLDHKTFRGMRHALASDFPRITVDLPADEKTGWFPVVTPLAIHYLSRSKQSPRGSQPIATFRSVASKPETSNDLIVINETCIEPSEPWFEFSSPSLEKRMEAPASTHPSAFPTSDSRLNQRLLEVGWSVVHIFNQSASAIVTARDSLVVAHSRQQLKYRIGRLLDPKVSDDEIRNDFFSKARSRKFQPGDTRGWKLSEIRERLRQRVQASMILHHGVFGLNVVRCRYRALDDRWLLWDRDLVDWPRFDSQATLAQGDWGLICRRQSPVNRPADYVLVSNKPVIDGVLRSDNRGNETVFPLHGLSNDPTLNTNDLGSPSAHWSSNLSLAWRQVWEARLASVDRESLSLEDATLAYLYAVLRTPSFRSMFQAQLVRDFPVVPLLKSNHQISQLIRLGHRLVQLHTNPTHAASTHAASTHAASTHTESTHTELQNRPFDSAAKKSSAHRTPSTLERESVERESVDDHAELDRWTLGAHRVVGRWCRDRQDRLTQAVVSPVMTRQLNALRSVVRQTCELERQLDQTIAAWGGWGELLISCIPPSKFLAPSGNNVESKLSDSQAW